MRLYATRRAAQRESKKLHPFGDPRHGRSFFDGLVISVQNTDLLIQNGEAIVHQIQEL